ncbi:VPLPA-CTERM sorting domain-containing protein [Parvularcula maris]|uniref:VPLPA-CTERM sorting domain-containing protein n=1 Tax=Parvularcula maris TaxID=2965077 RepID=A0A9X2RGQ2_9PROT|nr:VPLPA-CTERM sorting domain-containing protein [Parvularcula maris]MCQ8184155.1 VPLPA-CTERM sorting domain-containing protein [Parvularcula maris]
MGRFSNSVLKGLVAGIGLSAWSNAAASPVTIDFENVDLSKEQEPGQAIFDSGETMLVQDGFVVEASGVSQAHVNGPDHWLGTPTGSNYSLLRAFGNTPNYNGFSVRSQDGSSFSLTSFIAVTALRDADARFQVNFELEDGSFGTTGPFQLTGSLQTIFPQLSGIVSAAFFAVPDSNGFTSSIAIDDIVLNGVSSVPVPAAAFLFPLGIGGFLASRRRRG